MSQPDRTRRIVPQLVVIALTLCCGGARETPGDVSRDFWAAIQSRDLDAAREFCTAAGALRLESLFRDESIQSATVGQVFTNETTALAQTSLSTSEDGPLLVFNTHLIRAGRAWKVDADETAREMERAAIAASVQGLEDALREGAELLGQALEQGAREASEALREALEELEREIGEEGSGSGDVGERSP
jgi:hypothetical protein